MASNDDHKPVFLEPGSWGGFHGLKQVSPKWESWGLLRGALPYELAALAMGIEPRSIDPDEGHGFINAETFERFNFIGRAVCQWFDVDADGHVSFADLIRWADSISLAIPSELRAIGKIPCIPNDDSLSDSGKDAYLRTIKALVLALADEHPGIMKHRDGNILIGYADDRGTSGVVGHLVEHGHAKRKGGTLKDHIGKALKIE